MSKLMTIFLSIAFVVIIAFFCWHFLFSIYEVRFYTNFDEDLLETNRKYKISCVGINSLGWEITYRDLDLNFIIQSGEEMITIVEQSQKNSLIFIPTDEGKIEIEVSSKYALNPTVYYLRVIEK